MANWRESAKNILDSTGYVAPTPPTSNPSKSVTTSKTPTTSTKTTGSWRESAKNILDSRGYVPPEKRSYELKLNNGKNFGVVSYDAFNAINSNNLEHYLPKNEEEKKVIDSFKKYAEEQKKQERFPLEIEVDGKNKNFGNISYNAYKAIENNTLDNYKPVDDAEKKAIESYKKFAEEYAKEQREPENLGQGLLHGLGYTLGKFGAGALDFGLDISDYALALGATALRPFTWGSANEAVQNFAEERLNAPTFGDAWSESVESRYRVPDWYRQNIGTTAQAAGNLAVPIAVEYFTKGLAPTEGYTAAQLAKIATTASNATNASKISSFAKMLVQPTVSELAFGLGATASGTKEGYAISGDVGKAFNYGILTGLGEMATEKLFGGIAGTGIGVDELIDVQKYASKIPKIGKLASTKYGKKVLDIAFEGVEEMIMADANPVFQRITGVNPNAESATWKERGESFFQGILLSSVMNASAYAIGKGIDTSNKVKAIKTLNKSAEKLNAELPSEVTKFEPLKLTATKAQIEERNSEIQRIDAINNINSATSEINALFQNDESKLEPLRYDSTIDEIKQRQNELSVFATTYADLMVDELVKNNPEKFKDIETTSTEESPVVAEPISTEQRNTFTGELDEIASTEMPTVSVGDTFIDTSTNNILKVVGRDESNTTIEITKPSGEKETKTHPNHGADTLAVDDKYKKVETSTTTPAENVAIAENTTTTPRVNVGEVYKHKENGTTYTIVSRDDKNTTYTVQYSSGHISTSTADNATADLMFDDDSLQKIQAGNTATATNTGENASVSGDTTTMSKEKSSIGKTATEGEIAVVVDAMNDTLVPGAKEAIYESMPPNIDKSLDVFADLLIGAYKKHHTIGHIADYFSDGGKKVISAIEGTLDTATDKSSVTQKSDSNSNLDNSLDNETVAETTQIAEKPLKNQSESATIEEKKKIANEIVPDADKSHTVAYTNDNERVDLSFKVISVDDLVVSNSLDGKLNPDYPQELQPRDRSRTSSQSQIRQMANSLNPARLAESTSVSEGSPIVGADNVVESGNGRTLAIKLAYEIGTADEYKNHIISNADKYGIDVSNLPEKPILVRERITEVDRTEFTRKANESSIGSLSATEQAKVDAEKLTEDVLNLLVANDDGIINTSDNHNFISAVITKVFKNEDLNNVVGAEGRLSARGLERITNAIFYKAYGDASLSARLSESLDNDMKNATKVLLNIAPRVVSIKNGISSGIVYDFDFSTDIVSAIKLFEKCRNENTTLERYAAQESLFGKESTLVMQMAYVFEAKNRGAKQATDFYNLLLDTVTELGNPNQISLDIVKIFQTKDEILNETIERYNSRVESKNTITIPENIFKSESGVGREIDGRGIDETKRYESNENEKIENAVGVQQDNRRSEETRVVDNDEQLRQKNESVNGQTEVESVDNSGAENVDNSKSSTLDAELDKVIRKGSGFEGGRQRIVEFYSGNPSTSEAVTFLKKEYGIGGSTYISSDNKWENRGSMNHDSKGIKLTDRNGNSRLFSWNEVDARLRQLIADGKYLSDNKSSETTESKSKDNKADGVRYSIQDVDTEYLELAENPEQNEARLREMVDEAAKEAGYTIEAYHGTSRGDRVGSVFLPERATSGPMAFFTDNKEIAEGYAKSKQDTSMAYDPDYDSYETQFRIKIKDRDIPLYRAWGYLPFDARNRITQKAQQLREDWDGDGGFILDPTNKEANGGFQWQMKEARGNTLLALNEQWLNSGNLFNEENRYLEVLEMAGVMEEFKKIGLGSIYFKDPKARHEKVYNTYLRITTPFDTSFADNSFVDGLLAWYKEQDETQYERESMESDLWDKNSIDAYEFADRVRSDIENGTFHAWTSIPDSVTDYLKSLGYDGIKDLGGKNSDVGHTVWIPFSSEQIKSSEPVTYDDKGNVIPLSKRFNKSQNDIRYSTTDYAPTFYSHMGKTIDDMKQDKIGANSVISYLKGRGVKDEEIKWSGIEEFLDGKKSVTKAELQEFVANNQLQIEETVLDGSQSTTLEIQEVGRKDLYVMRGGEIYDSLTYDSSASVWVSDAYGFYFDSMPRIRSYYGVNEGGTRWGDYTLNGGKSYREITFKIPNSDYSNQAMQAHWGENAKGIIAHARVQEFEVDGKKMLFIEEIQSDWHNAGHKKGYVDKVTMPDLSNYEIRKIGVSPMSKYEFVWGLFDKSSGIRVSSAIRATEQEAWNELTDSLVKEEKRLQVPDAPFRNNYHEYVLKNLIRMAAEQGYDSIGWTPAGIQSKRWSDDYAEGYRIEYDQEIPKFLNKYGKKWGAKVGKTPLNGTGSYTEYFEVEGSLTEYNTVADAEQGIIDRYNQMSPEQQVSKVDTMFIAGQFVVYDSVTGVELGRFDRVNAPTRVWSMPITDAMKESVLYEGQTLYSLEKEGNNNEQRENLLSGNSRREHNESTRKQTERISRFKQKNQGKTRAERKSFAEELRAKGQVEVVIDGRDKYTLVKPEAYNDDMLSIVEDAKERGKEVGFFIGVGKIKFDTKDEFWVNGIKVTDDKILLRYDGILPPQLLYKHEHIHTEWNTSEVQEISDIISKSLSEEEKQKILEQERYAHYKEIYKDDADAIWEEFVCDVMAGMNEYTYKYIDAVVNYWYGNESAEGYNPSTYTESIDAGGRTLRNVGIRERLSLSDDYTERALPEGSMINEYHKDLTGFEWWKYYQQVNNYDWDVELKNSTFDFYSIIGNKLIKSKYSKGKPNVVKIYAINSFALLPYEEGIIYDNDTKEILDKLTKATKPLHKGTDDNIHMSIGKQGADDGRIINVDGEQLDTTSNYEVSKRESGTITDKKSGRYSLATDGILDLEDLWEEAKTKYGTIPKGEIPTRDVDVPKKVSEKDVVSRFARTMIEAGVTPDETVSEFEKAILDGTMTHEVITDKKASAWAKKQIEYHGFEGALGQWSGYSETGGVDKNQLALGMELYNQCITNKDVHNAMKIAAELVAEATRAGQTLQATRMLKRMTPDGQLYYLEKSVQKMNEEFKEKLGDKYKDIEVDESLMEEFLTQSDETKRNEAYDKICQNIADQIPATFRDKWNSWRYLAMLGNLRTHLRNIFGNAVFIPSLRLKNYVGAVIEKGAKVKTSDRTKSLRKSKEAVNFAKKDVKEMLKVLQGENAKYAVTSDIQGKRTIFKTKWLEYLRLKNFDFLEKEDMWFLKMHYTDALARLITIRNIDVNSITPQMLEKLRAYAVKEAQAATYRDANALAEGLNRLQKNIELSDKKAIRASGILLEGVMPFKKTPMNIAKQGLNYSPLGILKGVYKSFTQLKKGDTTITEVIDDISKGLSGTMVMLLGYFLASMGWLGGDEDKSKKEKEFDEMVGEQSYSLKIGDIFSYTIDWMTPSNLSLFIGVELYELTKDDFEFADVVGALSTVTEPLLELSVFSGVNGVIESAQYSDSEALLAIGSDMITSYLMQALPTIGGQISRIVDKSKREYYYTDKNSNIPQGLQRFIGQASSKIPFASFLFQPAIDEWGREETYGNGVERVLENTVSPGYYSANNYTDVDKELRELHERTGDDSVLPVIQQKKYTEDYVTYYMSAEDYTETKKIRGQKSFELVSGLLSNKKVYKTQNKTYSRMSDEEKVKAIDKCYEEAGDYAKEKMLEKVKSKSK